MCTILVVEKEQVIKSRSEIHRKKSRSWNEEKWNSIGKGAGFENLKSEIQKGDMKSRKIEIQNFAIKWLNDDDIYFQWKYIYFQWFGNSFLVSSVVISLFRDSDFEDLATGLLLSLGPTCGTLFRPKLDNRVTIYYSSRVNWKHFCSSSPEPFCGSISNEGPYKYSLLLLLLLSERIRITTTYYYTKGAKRIRF